jgi:RNA polymerase sigma factor (sigma-70 family)
MATAQLAAVVRRIRGRVADSKVGEQSDGALLRAYLGHGDQAAFEALLLRHGPMVLRVCRRALGNTHDAEDALQATFLVLAQKAASIRKRESLVSWLHGVAYRMATNAKRAAARRHKHESRANPPQPPDPALCASWQELQALLDEEVAGLPETLRAPFILCCLEGKSYAEAAGELGLQEGTIRNRLGRARKRLRERLARRGLALTTVLAAVAVGASRASAAVPLSLVGSIVRAAAQLSAGQGLAGGLVSGKVLALVEGVNQTMFLNKCKTAILLLLGMALIGVGLGVAVVCGAAGAEPGEGARQARTEAAREGSKKARPPAADAPAQAGAKEAIKVRGRVLSPDGKPFAGARLYLGSSSPKAPTKSARATSGDDGRFQFSLSRSELVKASSGNSPSQVMAVASDHGCDWAVLAADGKAAELTLRLVKDVPIRGRILDPDGRPVAGAKVRVTGVSAPGGDDLDSYLEAVRKGGSYTFARDWSGPLPGQPAALTTGADGRFRLAGIGRERLVRLHVEGPAIASADLEAMTRAAAKVGGVYGASFDYVAVASRPIRGVVRDKDTRKPLAGVTVGVANNPWCKAVTDEQGRYELLGLAKSPRYDLLVTPGDGLYFQRRAEWNDTPGLGVLTADIDMVRGLTVRGKVTDKATGRPVAHARIEYHPLYPNPNVNKLPGYWRPRSETTTGPDGSYALTALPGQGAISVRAPRPEAYTSAVVTLAERKAFFKVPIVQDDEGWLPVAVGGNLMGVGIATAAYNAVVLIEPGAKEVAMVKDVALEAPRGRKGRVVGPDGRPLSGVTVRGLSGYNEETLIGAEFTVRGLNPKAKRQLVFHHKQKRLGFFLKELRGDESGSLTIKLQPCGSASGRLVDSDGQPLPQERLGFSGTAGAAIGQGGYLEVRTDKEGRFHARGLVPGMVYHVATPSARRGIASLVVEPGKQKDLGDVKLPN